MHLAHPALVHFSVALLVAGGLAEAWGLLARGERIARFGERLLLLGAVSLVPTIASGYLAVNTVDVPAAAVRVVAAHERNAWFLLGLMLVAFFWKGSFQGVLPPAHRPIYALLLLAMVGLTIWSAILGGEMVYTHAIGVR